MKEHLEFPQDFTFKIVGDKTAQFESDVDEIFADYPQRLIKPKHSTSETYVSYSVTVHLTSYEELESIYTKISALNGLKFYC